MSFKQSTDLSGGYIGMPRLNGRDGQSRLFISLAQSIRRWSDLAAMDDDILLAEIAFVANPIAT